MVAQRSQILRWDLVGEPSTFCVSVCSVGSGCPVGSQLPDRTTRFCCALSLRVSALQVSPLLSCVTPTARSASENLPFCPVWIKLIIRVRSYRKGDRKVHVHTSDFVILVIAGDQPKTSPSMRQHQCCANISLGRGLGSISKFSPALL